MATVKFSDQGSSAQAAADAAKPTKPMWRGGRLPRAEVDRRVEQMLQIAAEEFAAHGFSGTSMDRLAERSGVAKSTMFRRFGSKEGLFKALVTRTMGAIHEGLGAVAIDRDQPVETLERLIVAYIHTAVVPRFNHMLFAIGILERESFPTLGGILLAYAEEGLAPVRRFIADLMADGVLSPGDPREAAFELQAMITQGFRVMIDDPAFVSVPGRARPLALRFLKAWA